MKKNIHLITSLICFALCGTSVQAATYYWDINGPTAGAGGSTPSGTWDFAATQNWSTNSAGEAATIAWANGNDAIFSAGSDATGAFVVELSVNATVGNLTAQEGAITIAGGTALNVGGGAGGKGIINVVPNATLTINSTVTGGDADLMISLVGTNTASGTINGTIVNGISYTKVEKREGGTWVLTGTNTYTGVTDIRAGTLAVSVLADGGSPSSIGTGGAGAAHLVIGLGNNAGGATNATLKYIGSGHSCNREIRMYGTSGPGGGILDASGTGPLVLTGPITRPVAAPDVTDKTLTLKGTNTDTNTISGDILNSYQTTNKTFVVKEGPGKWVLSGSQHYTGPTTVNEGTLVWNSSYISTSAVLVNSSATLGGAGWIDAPVTIAAGGTLSPGDSIGTLNFLGDLNLSGHLFIEVDKSVSPTSDLISAWAALNNDSTGTVRVKNLGPALAVGDTFVIFKDGSGNPRALPNGQAMTVVSDDASVIWNNNLAVNGSISVAALAALRPKIMSLTGAGTASVTVNYTNTVPTKTYYLRHRSTINGGWTTNSPGKIAVETSDSQVDSTASGSQRYYQVFYVAP
jgi:fibronectin-binding autotransporter adhesin